MNTSTVRAVSRALALAVVLLAGAGPRTARAGYAFAGQGVTNVLAGSVANGGLFWSTVPTWINSSPSLPYTNEVAFTLPACDRIVASRLVLTVWGGTADYVCQMTVTVNATNLAGANPLVFGTTADTNAVFSSNGPCAYGGGYGVWLVTIPVPGAMLHRDGTSNVVRVVETTQNGFDGRIQHVTLLAVYQSAALANTFDYAIAEGSGDIYKLPSGAQVSQRTAAFAGVSTNGATAAELTVLYTYGDTGQNDWLYFNGIPYGGDDVAQWNGGTTNYGPSVVSFDVLSNLAVSNSVTFSVWTNVPSPQETSLRPQLAALAVTRPAAVARPSLTMTKAGEIGWTTNSAGFSLESNTNLVGGAWTAVTNVPEVSGDQFTVTVIPSKGQEFFRLKKAN